MMDRLLDNFALLRTLCQRMPGTPGAPATAIDQ